MKPTMFIGSSREFLDVAHAIQSGLPEIDCIVWDQKVFSLASNTLETLVKSAKTCDLATFVFGADDVVAMRANVHDVTRDNVVFELGMFIGALDRNRCFFAIPADRKDFHVPSDLAGISAARFDDVTARNDPTGSVVEVCNDIRHAVEALQADGNLSGRWTHSWSLGGKLGGTSPKAELDLVQLGSYVRGTYTWDGVPFEMRGDIQNARILNAEYRSLAGKHGYSGTVHMIVRPDGRLISGKWSGWSGQTTEVRSGDCEWRLSLGGRPSPVRRFSPLMAFSAVVSALRNRLQ